MRNSVSTHIFSFGAPLCDLASDSQSGPPQAAREKFFLYPLWVIFFLVTGCVHYFLWVRPLFFGLDPLHIIEGVLIGITGLRYALHSLPDGTQSQHPKISQDANHDSIFFGMRLPCL